MVCATKQHTGKTSVSMALFANLRKHFEKRGGSVGYMKPVGQQWVQLLDETGAPRRVDKDAALAYQYFGLSDPISSVSPIVIGRGHTKRFLDGDMADLREDAVAAKLRSSYESVSSAHDFTIVEGTGHCGVGSVIGWNNARVAAMLGIDVVLVANGGIGSTFDELALNVMACRAERANIAGIIVNKVNPQKVDEVSSYLQRASAHFGWNAPLLGCVPFGEDLDKPSVMDLVHLFEGGFSTERNAKRYDPARHRHHTGTGTIAAGYSSLPTSATQSVVAAYTKAVSIAAGHGHSWSDPQVGGPAVFLTGREHKHRRFSHYELVTTSLERFMNKLIAVSRDASPSDESRRSVCFVTHTSRSDIIQGLLGHRTLIELTDRQRATTSVGGGLILAGTSNQEHGRAPYIDEYIRMASIPVLRSNLPMSQTLAAIKGLKPKMRADDEERVRHVIDLYAPYLEDAVRALVGEA